MDSNIRTYSREHIKKFRTNSPAPNDCFIINHVPSPKSASNGQTNKSTAQASCSEGAARVVSSDLPEIDEASLKSLSPGCKLNDTIVEFYMKHVALKKHFTHRQSFHIFNTFFYNKINVTKTRANSDYLKEVARKWDKDVKLYDKDYIVIPICHYHHWILVIVCFPRQSSKGVKFEEKPAKARPCLVIFDSLGSTYMRGLTDPIRAFMSARKQFERPKDDIVDLRDRTQFKDLYPRVQRQRNTYDCGIHLLHNFSRFFLRPFSSLSDIVEGRPLGGDWRCDTRKLREDIKKVINEKRVHNIT